MARESNIVRFKRGGVDFANVLSTTDHQVNDKEKALERPYGEREKGATDENDERLTRHPRRAGRSCGGKPRP